MPNNTNKAWKILLLKYIPWQGYPFISDMAWKATIDYFLAQHPHFQCTTFALSSQIEYRWSALELRYETLTYKYFEAIDNIFHAIPKHQRNRKTKGYLTMWNY